MKRRLWSLALGIVLILSAACGSGYVPLTGNVASSSAAGLSGGVLAPASGTPIVLGGAELTAFLARLQATNARVDVAGIPGNAIFGGTGHLLRVNGQEVQAFEYPNETALKVDTQGISPDAATIGNAIMDWAGSPHLFKAGKLVLAYVGSDPFVLYALTTALAPQFAGAPTGPLPTPTRSPFTPTPTATEAAAVKNAANCTDRAIMISDATVPDGTVLPAGKPYLKTWLLRNTGTCTWTSAYQLAYVRGEQMGVPLTVTLPSAVSPGISAKLSLTMTAPLAPGHYRGNWQLRNPAGKNFGISNGRDGTFWVDIVVRAPASTATATAIPSPTATATPPSTPEPSATPTSTPPPAAAPAATATEAPAPTATIPPSLQATPTIPPQAERVVFPPGASGVTLMVNLGNGRSQTYLLTGAAGQALTVDIQPGSALKVTDPQGQAMLPDSVSLGGAWTYQLPAAGDYTLVLTSSGPNLISFLLR